MVSHMAHPTRVTALAATGGPRGGGVPRGPPPEGVVGFPASRSCLPFVVSMRHASSLSLYAIAGLPLDSALIMLLIPLHPLCLRGC